MPGLVSSRERKVRVRWEGLADVKKDGCCWERGVIDDDRRVFFACFGNDWRVFCGHHGDGAIVAIVAITNRIELKRETKKNDVLPYLCSMFV